MYKLKEKSVKIAKYFKKKHGDEYDQQNVHWAYCKKNNYPQIVITEHENYSYLEYDVFPCRAIFDEMNLGYELHLSEAIYALYHVYTERFKFEDFSISGGSSSSLMKVHKKDAKKLAELLFDFIMEYLEQVKNTLEAQKWS